MQFSKRIHNVPDEILLTFLGTGTSTGVPSIGCNCKVCQSTDSRDKRLRASALVTINDVNLLIDVGPDFRVQILREGSPSLDALLITHTHYDHVGGIDDLRPYCYPAGFDIYALPDAIDDLRLKLPYCFSNNPYPGAPVFHHHVIDITHPFTIKGITIEPLAVNHYLLDIVGFRIGNLAYITDAKHIPESTLQQIQGVDTLVVNALRHKEHISHLNLSQALDIVDRVKPKRAWFTHISHDMGLHAEVELTLPENVKLAYDGLSIIAPINRQQHK